ncbi:MAG: rRNA maturation RNase YbeY, partial [Oligoflexales bacterium]|nr:rRNA maturation RNase YbeY [Oligoflexales bacterium]
EVFHSNSSNFSAKLKIIGKLLKNDGFELSVQFVSSGKIKKINEKFRNISRPTDVLSFPQIEWRKKAAAFGCERRRAVSGQQPAYHLGDIVISPEVAEKNALSIGHGLDREVCFLLVHGLLHLLGHDHIEKKEEKIMLRQQGLIMGTLGRNKHNPLWKNCIVKRQSP